MPAVLGKQHIGSLSQQKSKRHLQFPMLKMIVTGVSMISGSMNNVIGK